jgi:putative ABC transport system ATP-binding protein
MSSPKQMPSEVELLSHSAAARRDTANLLNSVQDAENLPILIDLKDVKRRFWLGQTVVEALRGVTMQIRQGEFVAVWGPSGSGKSTLMNVVGLIDLPSEGGVTVDGCDVRSMSDNALTDYRGRKVGFVFQSFNLLPVLSAVENVMLPLQIQGVTAREARERAGELLAEVGLGDFVRFPPDRLSGGQRQRVAIARALIVNPALVVADEPTANLDTENSRMVVDLMRQMNRAHKVTFVFTTHDPRLLDQVRRKVQLKDGRIQSDEWQNGVGL